MSRQKIRLTQQEFELRTWGGARRGAGRKPKGEKARLPHDKRPPLPKGCPAHVTLRVVPEIRNLQANSMFQAVRTAFWQARGVAGMRLTQFSVQSNHIHLIVEADDNRSFISGMRSLSIRLALHINRAMGRRGQVLEDRFHVHVLKSPREVERAVRYVMENTRIHAERAGEFWGEVVDPFTGGPCRKRFPPENRCLVLEPSSWLLRQAWGMRWKPRPEPPTAPEIIPLFADESQKMSSQHENLSFKFGEDKE